MRLNYDEIAHLYDEPSREHAPDEDLFAFIGEEAQARVRVLDIGCGTGSQLAANRAAGVDTMLVGIDRFVGMLRVAPTQNHGERCSTLSLDACVSVCIPASPRTLPALPCWIGTALAVLRSAASRAVAIPGPYEVRAPR